MGNVLNGRQNGRIEEVEANGSNAYCYPPKTGQYFGSHFIMGGERFEASSPEAYLFGENMDLNFLGSHPTPFPYSAPLPHEPTRTLRALINIRKESLRLVRVVANCEDSKDNDLDTSCDTNKEFFKYNIEFIFDSDVKCSITVHYLCTEGMTPNGVIYTPQNPALSSETYHYKRGANQLFGQTSHVFDPSMFKEEDLTYRTAEEFDFNALFPVVIYCVALEGEEPRQAHSLIAVVEHNHENIHSIKPLKQKLFVDGLSYLLQEIYGIENKNAITVKTDPSLTAEEEVDDNSSECVICMSDGRDTLILPCRHLCLCNGCADSLRYQANNCPICRAPFRALLQLKAVRKSVVNTGIGSNPTPIQSQLMSSNSSSDLVDVPPGYEPISLIEALNGPNLHSNSLSPFRTIGSDSETPINVRKYQKSEQKTRKSNQMNGIQSGTEVSESESVASTGPTARSRLTTACSVSTPEVIVSQIPVSPIKDSVGIEMNANNEVKGHELWRPSKVNSKPNKPMADDSGSASSSASSGTTENIALQERIRLLSHDKEDECDYILDKEEREERDVKLIEDETEMHSFGANAMSPPLLKDSPGNSSPVSIGISSASYPMMSLRDGIDEQQAMDADADLLSVATISSANNVLIRPEDESSEYFIPFDKIELNSDIEAIESMANNFNTSLLLYESSDVPENNCELMDSLEKQKTKQLSIRVKLAETEILEDSDPSPKSE